MKAYYIDQWNVFECEYDKKDGGWINEFGECIDTLDFTPYNTKEEACSQLLSFIIKNAYKLSISIGINDFELYLLDNHISNSSILSYAEKHIL